jgi:hypothetical protein
MRLAKYLPTANGYVVCFVPTASAVLRCNTAIYLLGSSGQSIAVFIYLVKYITKDANQLTDSLALIAKARSVVQKFPTEARPGETQPIRDLKKFATNILNGSSGGGPREMADTTVAFANMNGQGALKTHQFRYVFSYDAMHSGKRHFYPVIAAAGAPAGALADQEDEESMSTCKLYTNNEKKQMPVPQYSFYLYRNNPAYEAKYKSLLDIHEDPSESTTANASRQAIVDLKSYYASNTLEHLSLREFVCLVQIVPITSKEYEELAAEMQSKASEAEWGVCRDKTHGREKKQMFLLHKDHPCSETVALTLLAKQFVAINAGGKPPLYPTTLTPDSDEIQIPASLRSSRDLFGAYVVANYWPAAFDSKPCLSSGVPLTFDWSGFCKLCDYLYSPTASFVDQGRLFEITSLAFATREHPEHGRQLNQVIQQYRFKNADNLLIDAEAFPLGKPPSRHSGTFKQSDISDADREVAAQMYDELYKEHQLGSTEEDRLAKKDKKKQEYALRLTLTAEDVFQTVRQKITNENTPVAGSSSSSSSSSSSVITSPVVVASRRARPGTVSIIEDMKGRASKLAQAPLPKSNVGGVEQGAINTEKATAAKLGSSHSHGNYQTTLPSHASSSSSFETDNLQRLDILRRLNMGPNFSLNADQWNVIMCIDKYLTEREQGLSPEPLNLLVTGGPGAGKTYVLGLSENLNENVEFQYVSISGSAASLHEGGRTICNLMGFNPRQQKLSPSFNGQMKTLIESDQNLKFAELNDAFKTKNGVLCVDEISTLDCLYFHHVINRLHELDDNNNPKEKELPTGGVPTILSGDWLQIPGMGMSIPAMIFKMLINSHELTTNDDRLIEAVNVFLGFKRIKLTANVRAKSDKEYMNIIARMGDLDQPFPIDDNIVKTLHEKQLRDTDLQTEEDIDKWLLTAICLTTSNAERAYINLYRANLASLRLKQVLICWDLRTSSSNMHTLTPEENRSLRKANPELCGFFLRGAPCMITENTNPSKNLANGTQGKMNSIVFDESHEQYQETIDMIAAAKPGECVHIPMIPTVIIIDVKKTAYEWQEDELIHPQHATPMSSDCVCVGIVANPKKGSETLAAAVVNGKVFKDITYFEPAVILLYACTFDKAQGKTMAAVYLCLHPNFWSALSLPKLYVAFTRVETMNNLRVWPSDNLDLGRLKKLQHDPAVVCLEKAYDANGMFSKELYSTAYVKLFSQQSVAGTVSASMTSKKKTKMNSAEKAAAVAAKAAAAGKKQEKKPSAAAVKAAAAAAAKEVARVAAAAKEVARVAAAAAKAETDFSTFSSLALPVAKQTNLLELDHPIHASFERLSRMQTFSYMLLPGVKMQFRPEFQLQDQHNDANFELGRDFCIDLLAARASIAAISAVIAKPKYSPLLNAKVIVVVHGNHYHTITPCGRCWYSSFFSSLAICEHGKPSTFCIAIDESQLHVNNFYRFMNWFETTEGYANMRDSTNGGVKDMYYKYNAMKEQTSQIYNPTTHPLQPLPFEYWGTSCMLQFHPLSVRATAIAAEESAAETLPLDDVDRAPRQNKALLNFTQVPSNPKHYMLDSFTGGDNCDTAGMGVFPLNKLIRWFTHDITFPNPELKLQTHSMAYGSSHFYSISSEVTDNFLVSNTPQALTEYALFIHNYLETQPESWSQFGTTSTEEGAGRDLAIMSMLFNKHSLLTPNRLLLLQGLNASSEVE